MIKKLQRRFISIAMLSLLLIIIIVVAAINSANLYRMNEKIDGIIDLLVENEGKFPTYDKNAPPQRSDGHITEETPFETRYFIVRVNDAGEATQLDTGHIAAVSSSRARVCGGGYRFR